MKPIVFAICLCTPMVLLGQTGPEVSPSLKIPGTAMPYALDSFHGKPELIPIHHSNVVVNNHAGANFAGEAAGSFFYKAKITTELRGATAAVTLHSRRPVLYLHADDQDDSSEDHNENLVGYGIVRAKVEKDKRVVSQIRINTLTGHGKHNDGVVDTTEGHLPENWMTLTPNEDLADGQYVLTAIFKGGIFADSVYAFGVDPSAPEAKGAIHSDPEARPTVQ